MCRKARLRRADPPAIVPQPHPNLRSLETWTTFLKGELDEERRRTTSTRDRAGQSVSMAGVLGVLITGAIELLRPPGDWTWPSAVTFVVFGVTLVVSIVFALSAGRNVSSEVTSREIIAKIPGWADDPDPTTALRDVVQRYSKDIIDLRKANDSIVKALRHAHSWLGLAVASGILGLSVVLLGPSFP